MFQSKLEKMKLYAKIQIFSSSNNNIKSRSASIWFFQFHTKYFPFLLFNQNSDTKNNDKTKHISLFLCSWRYSVFKLKQLILSQRGNPALLLYLYLCYDNLIHLTQNLIFYKNVSNYLNRQIFKDFFSVEDQVFFAFYFTILSIQVEFLLAASAIVNLKQNKSFDYITTFLMDYLI